MIALCVIATYACGLLAECAYPVTAAPAQGCRAVAYCEAHVDFYELRRMRPVPNRIAAHGDNRECAGDRS